MANAQVLYDERVSATVATGTVWVDLAIITGSSFTANKTYLILANQAGFPGDNAANFRVRLVRGTGTVFTDAGQSWEGLTTQEHEESYMLLYTQPATPELIKLQISSSSTVTMTNILSQILAINMDDVGVTGTAYFYKESTADYTLTNTPTGTAVTSSFTPNGADRWLYIGNMIHDVAGLVTPIGFELYDSATGVVNSTQQEGEDGTNDFHGHNLYWVGIPTNSARTLQVRPFQSGASPDAIQLSSRVIAINLSKFAQSASAFSATEVQPAATPTYTTLATIAPNPTNTGDWVVIAFSVNDVGGTGAESETRLQINAGGGGLVDDPPYPSTAPSVDAWDVTDETAFSVFNLVALTSGAGRTMNWDARAVAGTTVQRFEDNGIVAFSVELASSSTLLVIQDATHAHASDAIALTQHNVLVTQEATHSHTSDAIALTQHNVLGIQDATHSHTADSLVLGVGLVIQDGIHSHTADNLGLVQHNALVTQDGLHNHTADNVLLTQHNVLSTQDATHSHAGDNLTLTQHNALAIQDGLHGHTSDGIVLVQHNSLSIQDSSHTHLTDSLGLVQHNTLSINDAVHSHSADNISLTQHNSLSIQDSHHAHTGDNTTLSQHNILSINDSLHAHLGDNVTLTAHEPGTFVIQDGLHSHTADNVTLTQHNSLSIQDGLHTHLADNLVLLQHGAITVQDGIHLHTADNITLSAYPPATPLVIQDAIHSHTSDNVTLSLGAIDIDTPIKTVEIRERQIGTIISSSFLVQSLNENQRIKNTIDVAE